MALAAVGRADLLRFLAQEADPHLRASAAALLGLPPLPASLFAPPEPPDEGPARPPQPAALPTRVPLQCPVLLHASPIEAPADTGATSGANSPNPTLADWTAADAADVEAMLDLPAAVAPLPTPLARFDVAPSALRRALTLPAGTEQDLPELLRRVSLARLPWPLPVRSAHHRADHLVILLDWAAPLRCFDADFRQIAQTLAGQHGWACTEVWTLPEGPGGPHLPAWPGMPTRRWGRQTVLVLLSDLGAGQPGVAKAWRRCLRRWRGRVGRVLGIVPCTARQVPASLRTAVTLLPLAIDAVNPSQPAAADAVALLLAALSPALTVEPALLRAMRLAVLPGSSPLLEREVWRHPDLVGNLPFRQWRPARQQARLELLRAQATATLQRVDQVLRQQHTHSALAQRDEEAMLLGGLLFDAAETPEDPALAAWQSRYQAATARCQQVARHLLFLEMGQGSQRMPAQSPVPGHCAASKAAERLQRMPVALRTARQAGADLLFAASRPVASPVDGQIAVPDGVDITTWQDLTEPPAPAPTVPIALWQLGQSLWLYPDAPDLAPAHGGACLLRAQVTSPWLTIETDNHRRVVALRAGRLPLQLHAWADAAPLGLACRWHGGGVQVLPVDRPRGAKAWSHTGQLVVEVDGVYTPKNARFEQVDLGLAPVDAQMPIGRQRITHSSRLNDIGKLGAVWGIDKFGAFSVLRFPTVNAAQTFRYIPPGTFQMGSPPNEFGRSDDEGPRHPVTLTQGYWLADTPCTQALWRAVMDGANPSRFMDAPDAANRPVENVSWDDVQTFLQTLQALLPAGCQAALPTEAEWEHAARAGTHTAYWWGNVADADRANMGEATDATAPAKAHSANPWGLHDVHGNVWEWCADSPRSYWDSPEVDPSGGVFGDNGVLRGGAWGRPASYSRSASRAFSLRGLVWTSTGFRLALRSGPAARGGPGPAAPGRPRQNTPPIQPTKKPKR